MTQKDQLWDVLLEVDFRVLQKDGYELQVRGEDVVILAHLHLVPSIAEFFRFLLTQDVPIPAKQVITIPKPYSTIASAAGEVKKLGVTIIPAHAQFEPGHYDEAVSSHLKAGCKKASQLCFDLMKRGKKPRLVLVDDGGMLTETWWRNFKSSDFEVVSVQQTASGVRRPPEPWKLAKIDVARSAAKKKFEARIISQGVLEKVRDLEIIKDIGRVGVAGVGPLGCALARSLVDMGKHVNIYDIKKYYCTPKGSFIMDSLGQLIRQSDFIFGCTGKNFLGLSALSRVGQKRHFASCASRDTEFLELLRLGDISKRDPRDPFGRLEVIYKGQTYIVENGGFPINFDRKKEQEGPADIVLTRALVLAGIFQAMCVKADHRPEEGVMLSPSVQMALVFKWLELTGQKIEKYLGFSDHGAEKFEWWQRNSCGEVPIADWALSRPELNEAEAARRSNVLAFAEP